MRKFAERCRQSFFGLGPCVFAFFADGVVSVDPALQSGNFQLQFNLLVAAPKPIAEGSDDGAKTDKANDGE